MPMDDYLTVAEAARALRVSDETVQRLCRRGQLPHIRIGRSIRIPTICFSTFVAERLDEQSGVSTSRETDPALAALASAWLRHLAVGSRPCAPETVKTHERHLAKYLATLSADPAVESMSVSAIATERALVRAIERLSVHQFASRYNVFMAVMSFTRYLVAQGVMESGERQAMKQHKPRRLTPPRRTVLRSAAEVDIFLGAVAANSSYNPYEKALNTALASIMIYAGLRVSEVAGLQTQHVDLDGGLIYVHHGKGGKARLVGINARLGGYLAAYARVRPRTGLQSFFLAEQGTALDRDYIIRRIRRIAKRSALDISSHGLRRTFATLNADAGRSINHIQIALGHSSITSTQAYLMADQRTVARAMKNW